MFERRADPAALRRTAEIVLVAAVAIQAARLAWALATPLGPIGDAPSPSSLANAPRDLTVLARFDPFFRAGAPTLSLDAPASPSGGYQLFGVRTDGAGRGSAILAGSDGIQASYAVGDTLPGGARLTRIAPDHVILADGASRLRIGFPAPTGAGVVAPTQPPPPPADAPIASILQPHVRDGGIVGFAVPASGAGAAFSGAGLQPGDVVLSINGQELTSGGRVAEAGQSLMSGGEAEIRFERGGKTFTTRARPQ
ncbi:type II secretion system protein N [Caulobacter sp. NIBR2454]|uniref:type II secretion system protein N n=1 Tax=Caulobacter sp. NIBR2454 TaxID=3015996 RepID=UPI0022B69CDB|nr:type II secretion system protein N [Caulobacter sp. NIBR2454]